VFPLTLAYVGDTVPYANRQATIAMLVASTGMASSLSTASGAVIAQALSWQWVFPVFGVIGAVITIYLLAVTNREQRVAAKVGAANAYKTALRSRPLMLLVALAFVEGSLYFGGFSFLGAMLSERYVISTIGVGAMLSIVGVAQLVTASFVPKLVKRLRESQIIALGAFAMGLSLVTAAITPSSYTFPISMVLLGGGFSLCHSTLQTRVSEVLPGLRGTSIALFAFALFLGNGIGTLAIGELIAAAGYTATIAGAGIAFWLFAWAATAYMAKPKA
jgi:predicted MFS family arabinose efflux permease